MSKLINPNNNLNERRISRIRENLIKNIVFYKTKNELTYEQLSNITGISQARLCKVIKNKSDLRVGDIEKIAKAMEIPPIQILNNRIF